LQINFVGFWGETNLMSWALHDDPYWAYLRHSSQSVVVKCRTVLLLWWVLLLCWMSWSLTATVTFS